MKLTIITLALASLISSVNADSSYFQYVDPQEFRERVEADMADWQARAEAQALEDRLERLERALDTLDPD